MKIILALLLTISALCGGTLDFRSGKVLCAEISTQAPSRIKKLSNPVFTIPETPVYAALTVLFDEGRRVGLFDYAIDIFGSTFHCIAIQRRNTFFSVADSPKNTPEIWKSDEAVMAKERYTLYFALDSSAVIGSDKREILELKALFHPGAPGDRIPFENLGSKAFTPQAKIPLSGKIAAATENKVSAPQPPKPTAPKTAAKADSKVSKPQSKAPAAKVESKVSKPQSKAPAAKVENKVSKPQSKAPAAKKAAAKKNSKASKSQKKAPAAKKKAEKK